MTTCVLRPAATPLLVAGNSDTHSQLRVWDVQRASLRERFNLPSHTKGVRCVAAPSVRAAGSTPMPPARTARVRVPNPPRPAASHTLVARTVPGGSCSVPLRMAGHHPPCRHDQRVGALVRSAYRPLRAAPRARGLLQCARGLGPLPRLRGRRQARTHLRPSEALVSKPRRAPRALSGLRRMRRHRGHLRGLRRGRWCDGRLARDCQPDLGIALRCTRTHMHTLVCIPTSPSPQDSHRPARPCSLTTVGAVSLLAVRIFDYSAEANPTEIGAGAGGFTGQQKAGLAAALEAVQRGSPSRPAHRTPGRIRPAASGRGAS